MRVLVAMSGGVDSSVAAALVREAGHEVVGATMKLWGGPSDSGCCSVADVVDARRVCDELGIEHHVFNFTERFEAAVLAPYASEHARGATPNPCAACNRHVKFGALLDRALRLGFDAIATGHHAQVVRGPAGRFALARGRDERKDQSYVLAMLTQRELARTLLPVGAHTKTEVRALAAARGLRTAAKAESQDVCFIASRTDRGARAAFLAERIALHPGRLVDASSGAPLGELDALELVTVGQRRGLNLPLGDRRYALRVDVERREVHVGTAADLAVREIGLAERTWVDAPLPSGTRVAVQTSAHGEARPATLTDRGIAFDEPARRCAPGQLVACYRGEQVVGSGVAA